MLDGLGAPTEFGKNSTLRISACPKRTESTRFMVTALPPNIVPGQVDVLPAQRRQVSQHVVVGQSVHSELRIAFDGDSVLFSDESEQIYQRDGLVAFNQNERETADTPMMPGPFAPFLRALHAIHSAVPLGAPLVRIALVTARGTPSHEYVIKTLRTWDVRVVESLFLGGRDKGLFLAAFGADIFFDDQTRHCESAARHVSTGHVPFGIENS